MEGIKCNKDGLARGALPSITCEGIFRNEEACYVGSFCVILDVDTVLIAEMTASMILLLILSKLFKELCLH